MRWVGGNSVLPQPPRNPFAFHRRRCGAFHSLLQFVLEWCLEQPPLSLPVKRVFEEFLFNFLDSMSDRPNCNAERKAVEGEHKINSITRLKVSSALKSNDGGSTKVKPDKDIKQVATKVVRISAPRCFGEQFSVYVVSVGTYDISSFALHPLFPCLFAFRRKVVVLGMVGRKCDDTLYRALTEAFRWHIVSVNIICIATAAAIAAATLESMGLYSQL